MLITHIIFESHAVNFLIKYANKYVIENNNVKKLLRFFFE